MTTILAYTSYCAACALWGAICRGHRLTWFAFGLGIGSLFLLFAWQRA
jgi:hypothetical protein